MIPPLPHCQRPTSRQHRGRWRGSRGQASVELLGVVPALVLVAAIVWQLLLAGNAAWLCATAASAGARAAVVGRDHEAAARSVLPERFEPGLQVELMERGGVRVRVRVPLLVPGRSAPLSVSATTGLGAPS